MKFTYIIIILLTFHTGLKAQNSYGLISFERSVDWIKIMEDLDLASAEEIDRSKLTWGKGDRWTENYLLEFTPNEMTYTYGEEKNTNGYSWQKRDFVLRQNFQKSMTNDWVDLLGKTYIIEDEAPQFKWKIHNEIKEIAGYLCMKAETQDTIKNQKVYAWFTDAIPVSAGPEGYYGLPGMILELDYNDGAGLITATKIEFEDTAAKLELPKKMKGKNISREEFNVKMSEYIDDAVEGKNNPYWQIRY